MHRQIAEELESVVKVQTFEPAVNPTSLEKPAFLLSCPFSYCTDIANNAWMQEMQPGDRKVNMKRAMRQFLEFYHFLCSEAVVYLLPAPGRCSLQDLVFTANLGIVPEHLPDKNTAILSNFTSEPRRGETPVGVRFFEAMGYNTYVAPHRFEGEAELKHLCDNVYIGGFGIRSEREAYEWMEREFDMTIVKVEEVDDYLYHVDTTIFPITREKTLVCTEMYEEHEIAAIEEHTEIIDVSADHCYSGICNSVRLCNTILNASHIHELKPGTEDYKNEIAKNRRLEDIAVNLGFEVSYFNLGEYLKGGALLSCMVMHLNRHSYSFNLL
jgi:N-dimethylarginine dimethylaminohydrolase